MFAEWAVHSDWEYYIYLKQPLPDNRNDNVVPVEVELVAVESVCAGPFEPSVREHTPLNTFLFEKGLAISSR